MLISIFFVNGLVFYVYKIYDKHIKICLIYRVVKYRNAPIFRPWSKIALFRFKPYQKTEMLNF